MEKHELFGRVGSDLGNPACRAVVQSRKAELPLTDRRLMKISIILPLSDRGDIGWKSLESALTQDASRSSYEVVAVIGGRSEQDAMADPIACALLERCDSVVRFQGDLDVVENRMHICEAGIRASSGDVVYFAEGHTILHPRCCRLIAAHFTANPSSQIVSSRYREVATSDLSRLIKLLKETRTRKGLDVFPFFSLGGQTAVRRQLFDTLYQRSLHSGIFVEVEISAFLAQNNIIVGEISEPFCDHVTSRDLDWQVNYSLMVGRAHLDQFSSISTLRWWQRVIFSCANQRWLAVALFPLSHALGVLLLRTALSTSKLSDGLGIRFLLLGMRTITLAGFCEARMSSNGEPQRVSN